MPRRGLPQRLAGVSRSDRLALAVATVLVVILAGGISYLTWLAPGTQSAAVRVDDRFLTVVDGPGGHGRVRLDTSLYRPTGVDAAHPAPAVIVAHGFGGTKDSVTTDAMHLADHGYVVLTYTARGFGASGGQVALDSPDYEVADARGLLDWLGRQPEVRRDGPDDPRVAITGGSYGGGLSLLAAAYDRRVDAIVPVITWNDLARSLFPDGALARPASTPAPVGTSGVDGVFKRDWTGLLFTAGGGEPGDACGRFQPAICLEYQQVAQTGRASAALIARLRRSSPAGVIGRIHAPTLLIQGAADSLFPLGEADANARGIAATGTPVQLAWIGGGHDTGIAADVPRIRSLTLGWLDRWLRPGTRDPTEAASSAGAAGLAGAAGSASPVGATGSAGKAGAAGAVSTADRRSSPNDFGYVLTPRSGSGDAGVRRAADYPGVGGNQPVRLESVTVAGPAQPLSNPAGGIPAAISSIPGFGGGLVGAAGGPAGSSGSPASTSPSPSAAGAGDTGSGTGAGGLDPAEVLRSAVTTDIPGQFAGFTSGPLRQAITVTGAPRLRISVASSTSQAVLFGKVYDVGPSGSRELPGGLVAPLRVTGIRPGADKIVDVALPALAHTFPVGHQIVVVFASTDQAYASPTAPATYRVGLTPASGGLVTTGDLRVPVVPGTAEAVGAGTWPWVIAGIVLLVGGLAAVGLVGVRRRPRRLGSSGRPLEIDGLRKTFGSVPAVAGLTMAVERNQVVGLLGPNGAGKTTALRMLMGLVRPDAGRILVFGEPIRPGADVLARIGSFVEGPGFLPHLSGLANLQLYWRSTGRPEVESRLAEALAVAGLGDAVHRRVRGYSQGMRQRLALAQAMLGLPDLLVLDEPANGLDPPQMRALRDVLRDYGVGGRAVLLSSHLLAEIEQTCSHVVVMDRGTAVAAGTVAEVVGAGDTLTITVDEPARGARVLADLPGLGGVTIADADLVVRLGDLRGPDLVAALVGAGVRVATVVPQRRLEDAFVSLVQDVVR